MKYLLDTHCWLWWLDKTHRLNSNALEIINDANHTILLSVASVWEIAIKCSIKKLHLSEEPRSYITQLLEKNHIASLPIYNEHVLQTYYLPRHHRDPFDRLLIAQAQIEKIPILTVDAQFKSYDVELVWAGQD